MPVAYVKAIVHPPTKEKNDSPFLDFRPSEMVHAVSAFHKTPVLLGHVPEYGTIGQVRRLEHEPGGPLYAHMLIEASTPGGKYTLDGIKNGTLRACSIGMGVNKDAEYTGSVDKIIPHEISICDVPGREGSDFLEFSLGDKTLYQVVTAADGRKLIQEKEPTEMFTNLLRERKKMDAQITPDPTSRIEVPAETTTTVNASGRMETLESIKKRLRLTDDGIALVLNDLEAKALQQKEQHISMLEKDWGSAIGVKRADLEQLPESALAICAAFNGNFQEKDAKIRAKHAELETAAKAKEAEANSWKMQAEEAKKENKILLQKLVAQKDVGLASSDERFIPVNASAAAVKAESSVVGGSADVGMSSAGVMDVNAAGGGYAGIVPRAIPASIFDNPKRLSSFPQYDYASVLKKAQHFNRHLDRADEPVQAPAE
jgi:hypothetical protein